MQDKLETRGFFDLKKQFIFYASYHNNPVNIAIHLLCIWNIFWTALVFQHYTPAFIETPDAIAKVPFIGGLPLNLATITTLVYVVSYVLMDPVAGSLGALLVLYLHQWTGQMVLSGAPLLGYPLWQPILVLHVFLWIVQFVGHGVYEGRAPALLDSWDQAFITAPLFVILETLFYFGYRSSFHKECMIEVEKEISNFNSSKSK